MVGACSISGHVDKIKRAEAAGAGALVIKSLFEEQVMAESLKLQEQEDVGAERFAESLSYFPPLEHAGPREHVMWVEKARGAVDMPLIASLNAITPGGWVEYARKLQDAGVNGLELNPYAVQTDPSRSGAEIEKELFDVVEKVVSAVTIPVSVKLSPFYTSIPNIAAELTDRGAKGLVLFNRFLQPDIDPEKETLRNAMNFSRPEESRLPLRYVALLFDHISADLVASTGIHDGRAVARQILAGATAVQAASALYVNDIEYIGTMNDELSAWMDSKSYTGLDDFRGKLSQEDVADRFAYERAQYVELLLQQV